MHGTGASCGRTACKCTISSKFLRTYVDWSLLTNMYVLIISCSGFVECTTWSSGRETFGLIENFSDHKNCVFTDYLEKYRAETGPY